MIHAHKCLQISRVGGLCTAVLFSIASLSDVAVSLEDTISLEEGITNEIEDGMEIHSNIFQNINSTDECMTNNSMVMNLNSDSIINIDHDINNNSSCSNVINHEISNEVSDTSSTELQLEERSRKIDKTVEACAMVDISCRYVIRSKSILDTLSFIEGYNNNNK